MAELAPTRLGYDEVDDATLEPSTARLRDGILSLDGTVRAGWISRPLAPGVSRRTLVPIVLRIEPVTGWRFEGLGRGTGQVLAGEFRADDRGGRVVGVIPGDLVVESPSRPRAWFEADVVPMTGRAPVITKTPPQAFALTPARRAGLAFGAVAAAGGFVALFAFFGLLKGLAEWDWGWDSTLTVYLGRHRTWPIQYEHAWHYLLPLLVAEVVGIVAFVGGTMASINPKRS
jgi:hypothetical protein